LVRPLTYLLLVCRELMDKGLRTFEAAMLANIMPGDAQEAKAVIPSLDSDPPRFSDDEIQEFVDIIRNYRKED
jgi:DNA-directed RNA polymerase subunit F